jgi:hypothetical protein
MSDETRNKLISALRQFRHNNDNTGSIARPEQGFVFAYDRDETEGLVASLEKKLEQAEARCAELEEALKPFAEEAEYVPDYATDMHLNYEMDGAEILEYANFDARDIHKAASVMRQQADEIERGSP